MREQSSPHSRRGRNSRVHAGTGRLHRPRRSRFCSLVKVHSTSTWVASSSRLSPRSAALGLCDQLLRPRLKRSLLEVIYSDHGDGRTLCESSYTQPALLRSSAVGGCGSWVSCGRSHGAQRWRICGRLSCRRPYPRGRARADRRPRDFDGRSAARRRDARGFQRANRMFATRSSHARPRSRSQQSTVR